MHPIILSTFVNINIKYLSFLANILYNGSNNACDWASFESMIDRTLLLKVDSESITLMYSPLACSFMHLSLRHAVHNACKLGALLVPPFARDLMWSISYLQFF